MFAAQPGPEPTPTDLDQQVDWLTYPHAELYRMVHEGVDLDGATDVSARWAALGEDLEQLSRDLAAAVAQVEQAWDGPAADSARASVNHLVDWTKDTGVNALAASGCVTREINNLAHARRVMPAPFAPPVDTITPDTFNGKDFTSVAAISSDNTQVLHERREVHKQAAGVMQEFQGGSREVYGTVPAFSSPYTRVRIAPPKQKTPKQKTPKQKTAEPQLTPPQHHQLQHSTASTPHATPAAPVEARPDRNPPAAAPVRGPVPAAAAHEDEAEHRTSGSSRSMGGMVPGMGGAQREEDQEHKAKYLEADDDLWGSAGQVAPPVIGDPDA